jgi:hypothetical protein
MRLEFVQRLKERCRAISMRFVCIWNVHDDFFRGLFLLLRSREFFIFQIAEVHLLHSATWWRPLGQKYLLTAEVTAPIKGRKVGRLVWE